VNSNFTFSKRKNAFLIQEGLCIEAKSRKNSILRFNIQAFTGSRKRFVLFERSIPFLCMPKSNTLFSVIELVRWLMLFFEVIGRDPAWSKTTFYLLAEFIHELALLDENSPQSFPISSFFESQDQMVEVLKSDFDYDHTMALKFQNISLTPSFFVNAFNEVCNL
jgi:hypothetical protein